MTMTRLRRLKRWVAPGLRLLGATRNGAPSGQRPDENSTARELIQLAWPIAAAMFGETALGLVDTKLVGGLGPAALGGVGVASTLMFMGYATVFGLMRGVKVRSAYAVGHGMPHEGVRYAQAGVLMGAGLGLLLWWLGRDVSWALSAVGIDPALVVSARDFFAAITWGAPATCSLAALINHRQGLGDSRSPMAVGIAGNVVNALLSYGLIYGHFGLPALGVRGSGFGTATTEWLEMAALLTLLARDARRARGARTVTLRQALRGVADLGVPTGLQFGAEMFAFMTFTAILGTIGRAQVAAHQIALATIRTSFLPGMALSEAASVLVGQSLAQKRLAEADRVTRIALVIAVGFMASCGVVFGLFGGLIARAFTSDAEVALVARRLLWVAAGFQILDAVTIVLRGALRGAKDVRVAAVIGIAAAWTCVPSAAYLLGKLAGWGALGGWCGFLLETSLASVLFWRRWNKGAWRRTFAEEIPTKPSPELAAA
jgi:MATE family multidrug resistance protein